MSGRAVPRRRYFSRGSAYLFLRFGFGDPGVPKILPFGNFLAASLWISKSERQEYRSVNSIYEADYEGNGDSARDGNGSLGVCGPGRDEEKLQRRTYIRLDSGRILSNGLLANRLSQERTTATQSDYARSPEIDPSGPTAGEAKVLRGGHFLYPSPPNRASKRLWGDPKDRSPIGGFPALKSIVFPEPVNPCPLAPAF